MTPTPKSFHRGCTGKQPFANHEQAAPTAQRMRRKYSSTVEAYHCQHCGKWHVGGTEKKRKRFKREEAEV